LNQVFTLKFTDNHFNNTVHTVIFTFMTLGACNDYLRIINDSFVWKSKAGNKDDKT